METVFRVHVLGPDGAESIQVLSLPVSYRDPAPAGGFLRGLAELRRFIEENALDSIVQIRQVGEEQGVPLFERDFYTESPERMIEAIRSRGSVDLVLGATTLTSQERARRVAAWFERRAAA
jgi:hypothetical protein